MIARDLAGAAADAEVVVIGGGIVGATVFRELAFSGLNVLLIERDDFCNDISSGSTEMAHGGFRYLLTVNDWPLVIESIVEREVLHYIAPHLVMRLHFYMPLYRGDAMYFNPSFLSFNLPDVNWKIGAPYGVGSAMVEAGMIMYRLFAAHGISSRNLPTDPSETGYKKMSADEILSLGFNLNPDGLSSCFQYTDSNIEDVERLVLENILSGLDYARANNLSCAAVNRAEFAAFADDKSLIINDLVSGEEVRVKPKVVVNAAGAGINTINEKVDSSAREDIHMIAGSHVIVPRTGWDNDDLQAAVAWWVNKKIMFSISKGSDRLLVGTHERYIPASEVKDRNCNYKEDLIGIYEKTRQTFPNFEFEMDEHPYYTRVRPLKPDEKHLAGDSNPTRFSRRDYLKVIGNMVSVSGKLGPSRCLAEHVATNVFDLLHRPKPVSLTAGTRLYGGDIDCKLDAYVSRAAALHPDKERGMLANLITRYGSRYSDVISGAPEGAMAPIDPDCPDSRPLASLLYAFNCEGAINMVDAFRRTGVYKHLGEGLNCIDDAAAFAGKHLGWDNDKVDSEISGYRQFMTDRKILR